MEVFAYLATLVLVLMSLLALNLQSIRQWMKVGTKARQFPGPPKHWLFGNLMQIRTNPADSTKPPIFKAMLGFAEQYGSLYYLRMLWLRTIVCTDPVINAQVMKAGPNLLQKHERSYVGFTQLTSPPAPNILSRAGGAEWKAIRKAIAPAFTSANLKVLFPKLLQLCGRVCCALEAHPPSVPVDMDATAQRVTVDTIAAFGFDRDFGAVCSPESYCLTVVQHVMRALQLKMNPIMRNIPWSKARRESRYWCSEFDKLVGGLLDDMAAQPPGPNTIMAHLLAYKDPVTGTPLSRAQLKSEMGILWIAGFETTSHTIAWTMGLLAAYPEADQKVAEELDRAGLLGSAMSAPPREVSWDDLAALPYLNACILESMRLFPVVSSGTSRFVDHDLDLGKGVVLPQGTTIWAPFYSLHRNPRLWTAADDFLPERWLSPNPQAFSPSARHNPQPTAQPDTQPGMDQAAAAQPSAQSVSQPGTQPGTQPGPQPEPKGAEAAEMHKAGNGVEEMLSCASNTHGKPTAFMPFSQGPRDCVGQALAMLELRTVLSVLLSRFRFTLPADFGGRQGLENRARQYITLQPEGGLPLLVHPR